MILERLINDVDVFTKGSIKVNNLKSICSLQIGYSVSDLTLAPSHVKAKIGMTYEGDLLTTFRSNGVYQVVDGKARIVKTLNRCLEECRLDEGKYTYCGIYVNNGYLHVPDIIPAYLVKFKEPFYTFTYSSYGVYNGETLTIYRLGSVPHYAFDYEFEPTEDLEKLLRLTGIFDAYKRGLFQKKQTSLIRYYLFSPLVHFAYFIRNKTTYLPIDLSSKMTKTLIGKYINEIEVPENPYEEMKRLLTEINPDKLLE